MNDLVSRQAAIDAVRSNYEGILDFMSDGHTIADSVEDILSELPSAQPEYEPVTAEEFAKTMSVNTIWGFATWGRAALALMNEQGFVICKKTM